MAARLHRQLHGYRSGHQLLHSTTRIERRDQDLVDQLSDMAGPLRPGEKFDPYVSAYPLPSSEYYVLARTEQDHVAPRAGCVLTNSLLVPRTYWEREASPAELVGLLERSGEEDALPALPARHHGLDSDLEPVNSPLLAELVEALFLRERRPVVVFDAANPILISVRLLTAFWPGMRGAFSLCTFALSPRSFAGKPFDLVFAPESARSRFSDWGGRRIGPSARTRSNRHRWAEQIEVSVFQDASPTLLPAKHVQALGGREDGKDEAFLRLLMRWGDLQEKAWNSPMAVLGLIDIAKSRGALDGSFLEPEICNAMEIAARNLPADEAWSFLSTLMGKLSERELSPGECQALHSVVDSLIRQEWRLALEFLVEDTQAGRVGNSRLAGMAAGRLAAFGPRELKGRLARVPADALVQILLLDDELLALALTGEDEDASSLGDRIIEGFHGLSREERAANATRLLAGVQGGHQSALVAEVVSDMTAERLIGAVELIWGERGIRGTKLGDTFCDAAIAKGVDEELRMVFAGVDGDEETDRCIARLLKPLGRDMKWILENSELGDRRLPLLGSLVERASDEDLETALSSRDLAEGVLDMLMRNVGAYGDAAARIIVLPLLARGEQVKRGLKLFDQLAQPMREVVGQCIAIGVLADAAERETKEIETTLDLVLPYTDLLKVVDDVFAVEKDGTAVSELLQKIGEFTGQAGAAMDRSGGRIVDAIASRDGFDLTASGAVSLAELIERAKSRETDDYVQMCCRILPFAMAARQRPASAVVVASFPTVHNGLKGARRSFGLMHLFMLAERDKTRALRKEIVRAYMNSDWPPEDLAVAGFQAKALGRILKRVIKEPGGRRFLNKIEKGTIRLKKDVRRAIVRKVKETRRAKGYVLEAET